MKNIKTTKAYSYQRDFPEEKYLSAYHEFDELGNETFYTTYTPEGLETKVRTIFNDKGQKLEEIIYLDEENIAEQSHFTYNEAGQISGIKIAYADGSETTKSYQRNTDEIIITSIDDEDSIENIETLKLRNEQLILEKLIVDGDGAFVEKFVNIFDENDRMIQHTEYSDFEHVSIVRKMEFDAAGNVLKQVSRNADGKLHDIIKYKYNENNKIIEQNIRDVYIIKYTYNIEEKTILEENFSGNGMLESYRITRFDAENRLKQEEKPYSFTDYEYTFFD